MPRGLTKLDRVFFFIVHGLVAIVVLPMIVISVIGALTNPAVTLGVLLVLGWLGKRRARQGRRRVPVDDAGEPRRTRSWHPPVDGGDRRTHEAAREGE